MSEELESLVPHLLTILAAQRCFAYSKFIDWCKNRTLLCSQPLLPSNLPTFKTNSMNKSFFFITSEIFNMCITHYNYRRLVQKLILEGGAGWWIRSINHLTPSVRIRYTGETVSWRKKKKKGRAQGITEEMAGEQKSTEKPRQKRKVAQFQACPGLPGIGGGSWRSNHKVAQIALSIHLAIPPAG
jgi:hypothetical protein